MVVKFHDRGQKKIEWRRVRKNINFLILFIPRSSDCEKPFRGFSEIFKLNISYEFTSFSIFWPNQKIRNFLKIIFSGILYISCAPMLRNFQRHSYTTCARSVFLFCNYLIHHFSAITEFSIFLGHPHVHSYIGG